MKFFTKNKTKLSHILFTVLILGTLGLWLYEVNVNRKTIDKETLIETDSINHIQMKDRAVAFLETDRNVDYNNDFKSLGVVLTGVITLMGVVLNYVQKNQFEKIDLKLEQNNLEHKNMLDITSENYANIVDDLKVLKDLNVRKDVITNFRNIVNSYTRMAIDERIKLFIDDEGERLVTFAQEIMDEKFNQVRLEQAIVKLDSALEDSLEEVLRLFGEPFHSYYVDCQSKNLGKIKLDLLKLASDDLINHKYERFKNLCETFLHTHLVDIVRLHLILQIK